MTLVMDGVKESPDRARAVERVTVVPASSASADLTRPKKLHRSTMRANAGVRFVTGMDGVRRQVPLTPREAVINMKAPVEAYEATVDEPARRRWKWRRSLVSVGLVATAFAVSVLTVQLEQPRTGAKADAAVSVAPQPSATPVTTPKKTGLQELVNAFAAPNPNMWGIVVKDLGTGETATYRPDHQFTSASLYKLFVAQRIYQRIDLGQLTYGQAAGGGTGRNIDGCLTVMINISDNACGRALGTILGWGAQNQALQLEGYQQTNLATPQKTSAQDVATLLERLNAGTLLSEGSAGKLMGLLKSQRVNNRLPLGLPAGTVIAHKTGDLDGVVHDAGIVYGPKTNYLVVVMSGPWATPAGAPAQFANLSHQLWNFFEN
jgi:beta-lactamase class A